MSRLLPSPKALGTEGHWRNLDDRRGERISQGGVGLGACQSRFLRSRFFSFLDLSGDGVTDCLLDSMR